MMLLLRGYEWFDDNIQRIAGERGLPTLTRSESMLMIHLGDGVTRPTEIAKVMGVSRQAVHQTIAGLARKQVLELVPDPSDGRAKILRFRADAADLRDEIVSLQHELESILAERIGVEEVDMMRHALNADWGKPNI